MSRTRPRPPPHGTVKAGPDGFALVSPDKKAELKLRGLMQFDGRFGLDDDKDNDTFLFRRVRPTHRRQDRRRLVAHNARVRQR